MHRPILSRLFDPRALLALGLGLAATALGVFGWFAWQLGEVTTRNNEQNMSNMARVLAEHTSRSVQAADLILRDVAMSWAINGPTADAAYKSQLRGRILDRLSNTPQARSLVILDADGNMVITSTSPESRRFNGADRDYFVVHRDDPGVGLFVGIPFQSRLSNQWGISLSRRVTAPDGSFAGVVVMPLEPKYFEEFHGTLNLGDGGSITLFRDDGILLTRWPHREDAIGKSLPGTAAVFEMLKSRAGPHVMRSVSSTDSIERIRVHLKAEDCPVVVVVTTPIATVLAPVAGSRLAMLAAGTTIAAVLLLLFGLLSRHVALKDALARRLAEDKAVAETGWQAAVESERIKTLFWNSIGHDLRSPLCAMQTFVDLVLSEKTSGLTAAQKEYLGHVNAAVRMQFSLIDDLLDSARLESGRVRLEEEEIDLVLLVEQVADLIQPEADQHGITFLPCRNGREVTLWADHRRLMRVVLNIVSNAVKYTPSPGTVTLRHEAQADGGVAIIVTDTGIGMTPSEIKQAMQAYARVDNELTRARQGSGLGLSIARGLIELHDGALTIDSAPGKGTTVTIRVPPERVIAQAEPAPLLRLAGE